MFNLQYNNTRLKKMSELKEHFGSLEKYFANGKTLEGTHLYLFHMNKLDWNLTIIIPTAP